MIHGAAYTLGGRRLLTAGEDFYIAPGVQVIGSVRLGAGASLWFNAVLRGDEELIDIGAGSNVQDGSVLHADAGTPTVVGNNVTVGHMVLLHGCRIGDDSLIGNGAIVLDGAIIGRHCIVAAGGLVPPRAVIADGCVVMGSPARMVRMVTDRDRELIATAGAHYRERAQRYRTQLRPLTGR